MALSHLRKSEENDAEQDCGEATPTAYAHTTPAVSLRVRKRACMVAQ